MGNQPPSLTRRLRHNDRSLDELELTVSPTELGINNEDDLAEFLRALRRNRTVTSVVMTNAFTDVVIGPTWRDFLDALISAKNLEQVELLETDIPFWSLPRMVSGIHNLRAIGLHDGLLSLGIKRADIEALSESLSGAIALEEFVWEQNFESVSRGNNDNDSSLALDSLLASLAKLPNLHIVTLSARPTSKFPLLSPMALESFCQQFSNTVKSLDLSGCGLGAFHFEILASTLAARKSLLTLHIQRNNACDLTPILQLVQENCCLQHVVSDASDVTKQQLDFWLVLNETVRPRMMAPSGRFRVWSCLLAEARNHPSVLFYLLDTPSLKY